MLSKESLDQVKREIAKYPPERKSSAVMATLRIAQEEHGWLSVPLMDYVAELLGMRPIQVYEVATFYSMYDLKPVGRHKISICTNISCMLCGSDAIVKHLEQRLGIKLGETTPDGKVTLKEVECLAACCGAPMFQIGKTYYENLTSEEVDRILEGLK
ncbi:MAG TPA: NADH-quinone oxidoreductase subunit NuoE [Acidiferrobacterales bacterium]|nr:NADH-quinone oxidoreductase subunit NuoE [Acidiferrobacterales bacterium]